MTELGAIGVIITSVAIGYAAACVAGFAFGLVYGACWWIVRGVRGALTKVLVPTPALDLDAVADANVEALLDLKAAMMKAHPDHGGSSARFRKAFARYDAARKRAS